MNDDLISRQAAIDALKAIAVPRYKDPDCEDVWERDRTLDRAIDVVHGLPAAERKKWKWIEEVIDDGHGYPRTEYTCPFCQYKTRTDTNYCPECGTRLSEE